MSTQRVMLGPTVSNPLTRHPAVVASAIASINELSKGRAFLGLGSGDSAVLNLGLRPARLAELHHYIQSVRDMLAGETAEYRGDRAHVRWSSTAIPIASAASSSTLAISRISFAAIYLAQVALPTSVCIQSRLMIERNTWGHCAASDFRASMVESSVMATLSSSEEVAPSLTHSSRSISARRSGSDVPAGLEHPATAMAPLCPEAAITVAPVYPGGRGVAVGRNPLVSSSVAVASGVDKGVAIGPATCVAVGTSLGDGCESETVLSAGKTYCPHAMSEVTITRASRAIALATAPLHSRM